MLDGDSRLAASLNSNPQNSATKKGSNVFSVHRDQYNPESYGIVNICKIL